MTRIGQFLNFHFFIIFFNLANFAEKIEIFWNDQLWLFMVKHEFIWNNYLYLAWNTLEDSGETTIGPKAQWAPKFLKKKDSEKSYSLAKKHSEKSHFLWKKKGNLNFFIHLLTLWYFVYLLCSLRFILTQEFRRWN